MRLITEHERMEGRRMQRKTAVHRTEALFSDDDMFRFNLKWRWAEGKLLVAWLVNPATATEIVLDKSVMRIMHEAKKLDLAGFIIINLYAYRSTKFKEMPPETAGSRRQNEQCIREILADAAHEGWPVVAAWGEDGWQKQEWAISLARDAGVPLLRFGDLTSRYGAPRHPGRMRNDIELVPWIE